MQGLVIIAAASAVAAAGLVAGFATAAPVAAPTAAWVDPAPRAHPIPLPSMVAHGLPFPAIAATCVAAAGSFGGEGACAGPEGRRVRVIALGGRPGASVPTAR